MLGNIVMSEVASAWCLNLVCNRARGGKSHIGNQLEWDLCMEEGEG